MTPLPCTMERPRLSAREHASRFQRLQTLMDELSAPDLCLGRASLLRARLFELLGPQDAGSDTFPSVPVHRPS